MQKETAFLILMTAAFVGRVLPHAQENQPDVSYMPIGACMVKETRRFFLSSF